MKKITLALMLLVSLVSTAQKLTLTPAGLRSEADPTKDFVVVEVEGKTAAEMYKNVYEYIQKTYKNPLAAINARVEDSYIQYDTHISKLILAKMGFSSGVYDVEYNTRIDFKDGKAKISFTEFTFPPSLEGNKYKFNIQGGTFDGYVVYNKKGELKDETSKLKLEVEFNLIVDQLKEVMSGAYKFAKKEEW
jgi:hypothetical protein